MTSRSWCFTWHSPPDKVEIKSDKVRYAVWQREVCPQTAKEHYQGYLELVQPLRLSAVKKLLGDDKIHLESRKGTRDQARAYCMKQETRKEGPWEHGEWLSKTAGRRADLTPFSQLREMSMGDFAERYPHLVVRYARGVQYLKSLTEKVRCHPTSLTIYWGPPGSGKSSKAFLEAPNAFWKQPDTRWWDGYQGHKVVVMDDFTPSQMPLATMLRLADRYPLQVEVKGGSVQFVAERIIITANTDPRQWYCADPAWCRRITEVQKIV